MARLVIVSNRVPTPSKAARAGGLAIALKDAIQPGTLWFGWSGHQAPQTSSEAKITNFEGVDYATIDLKQEDYQNFYVGFANSTLWPLLHFRLGLMEFRRENLEGYRSVNEIFAKVLAPLLRPDDIIWVHDYHLIPLADELRRLGVKNALGFFLHIPFVPSSMFAALPRGEDLLHDFCAYDVVGFQTEEHRHDFLDSVRRIIDFPADNDGVITACNGRKVRAVVTPIGIDSGAFRSQAIQAAKSRNTRRLTESLVGRKLMIGADRLDYSKGLPNRFEAFNRFLERFPQHKNAVSFLQIAAPSREDVSEYAALRHQLNRLAGDINGRHGAFDWVPLRYMSQSLARSTLAGFYRFAQIGVVTPLRDGMNLVAHEYVAAQDPEDPGVLILSNFAGVAAYFEEALIVNPYDPDEIAEAMHEAMVMSKEERQSRHKRLFEKLQTLSAQAYCDQFLKALSGAQLTRAAA
ncbi:trehalose 6-phosphate synthase [Rhizomicrobium palustre]|uniref:Trehalose 6-phosphate synthase n=1 Tax=Rhizomicrobium palustre TaxID=189966 RepID=A0A846N3N6_9PROT|nr:trehalose-6-phosphate synthase [Rhizomicrobium palustre]NIK89861.1 trehalose 6-phosphate synthase [Rhizomicrobium palustre]